MHAITLLAGLIAVASSLASHVTLIDDATLTVVGKVDVGGNPHEIALSSDHRLAWVANTKDKSVTVVDLVERRPLRTLPLVDCMPHDLRASRDRKLLWITCAPEKVILEVDAADGTVRKRHDVGQEGAWMLAVSRDEKVIATANLEGGSITFIDRKRGAKSVKTEEGEIGIEYAADGTLWTTNIGNGAIALWDRSRKKIGSVTGGKNPARVKFTPDRKLAVITDRGLNGVAIVDVASRTITKTVPLDGPPKIIALSPNGKRAAVSSPTTNKLFIVDLDQAVVVEAIDIDEKPDGVTWAAPPRPKSRP